MIDFVINYYVYIIILIVILGIRFLRFRKSKRPIFKDYYNLQIIQYSFTALLFINLLLDISDISLFIDDIMNFSEMTTISGVLSGFIFAGISILYSFMGNEKISENFKYNFMDHVFTKLFLSIISSVFVIILYVILLIFPDFIFYETIRILITLFLLSLLYFILSIYELHRFLRRLKKAI